MTEVFPQLMRGYARNHPAQSVSFGCSQDNANR